MKQILTLFIGLFSISTFAQNGHDEIIQRFLKERERMIKDIMEAFGDDKFFQDDFFQDDMFEALKQNGLGGFKGFSGNGENIKVEEKIQKDGTISVIITPKSKDTDLNIETTDSMITIKSEVKLEEESKIGSSTSKSFSVQSFSRSVSIPQGYKAKTPVKKGVSIIISLVPSEKNLLAPNRDKSVSGKKDILRPKNKMVPIKKAPGEETI